jgi:hypothetical protein
VLNRPLPATGLVVLVLLAPLAALAVAIWPATTLLCVGLVALILLAWRAPGWGLAAAVLLFGFEGSVKILLWLEDTPLPGGFRAAGAATLDLGLVAAVVAVVCADRLETPRALWRSAGRLERVAACALGAWLVLSVIQIAWGFEFGRGLRGFRVFQAYTVLALVAAIVFARSHLRLPATRVLLAIGGIVSLYAAFRAVRGASPAEEDFATSVDTVTVYGETLRTVGSFSSAVGLTSFLTPVAVFALVTGLLLPQQRRLAWAVAALAVVGLIGSYTRVSLFAMALGIGCAVVLVLVAADLPRRRKLAAAALALVALAAIYGAVRVASSASPELRERAGGIIDPLNDESVRLRIENWKELWRSAVAQPQGLGVGAVGRASGDDPSEVVTADNSFLKVLVEQGFLGLVLFAAGLIGMIAAVAGRLRRAPPEAAAIGLAALSGFVAFLGISFAGEYVEQPGKVIAWGLLGIAVSQALGSARTEAPE